MTKFIAYFNLCPIPDPKEFLGISPDREDGQVIVTLGRNIAIVMKISTQKQMHSWSVLEKLTSKVVYDRRSQNYVGVFSQRALRCWDENTTDVNKCKKLKFQKTIVDLVTTDDDTYVLYGDGSFEKLADAIQSRKEQVDVSMQQMELTPIYTLSSPAIYGRSDGSQVLTYFERHNERSDLVLVCTTLEDHNGEKVVQRFDLKRGDLDLDVSGYAVIEGDNNPVLFTIWSDKRIFLLNLDGSATPDKSPGNYVSLLTALKVDSPITVLGISRNFVAIYGANSGQEGASLLLYNTKFKVVNAKQFFKVYFDYSRMWLANEYLMLAMGQNLSVVSYHVSKELLAELVGSQINSEIQRPIARDHINEEELLEDCLQLKLRDMDALHPSQGSAIEDFSTLDAPVADGKTVPFESIDQFNREFSELGRLHMDVEMFEVERPMEDVQITLMKNCNDKGFVTSEVQFIAQQLERCGASELEISEKLLTVLVKSQLIDDIGVCLRRYSHVPEKALVKTLSYLLDKILSSDDDKSEVQRVLTILISCEFDDKNIVGFLRRELNYPKVLFLLEHLHLLLIDPECIDQLEVERTSFVPNCVRFEMQLIAWFGVLLNAHIQSLALAKDGRLVEVLVKWSELLASYKREIGELQEVLALLRNLTEKKDINKEATSSKWYYIEDVVW